MLRLHFNRALVSPNLAFKSSVIPDLRNRNKRGCDYVYIHSLTLLLQSSSQTPTSPRPRGPRWWPCGASSWAWSPTGPRPWRRPCRGGAPSLPRPPVSPPWTPTASPSMCSPTVRAVKGRSYAPLLDLQNIN